MNIEKKRYVKELVYFSSIGMQMAFSIIIGYFAGNYLDRHVFHTTPWFTYILLLAGIAAGFRNIALAIKKIQKIDWDN